MMPILAMWIQITLPMVMIMKAFVAQHKEHVFYAWEKFDEHQILSKMLQVLADCIAVNSSGNRIQRDACGVQFKWKKDNVDDDNESIEVLKTIWIAKLLWMRDLFVHCFFKIIKMLSAIEKLTNIPFIINSCDAAICHC